MSNLFIQALLGHLISDYLLQNKVMAIKKSERGLNGFLWCLMHCLIYTFVVSLFLWTTSPLIITLVFLSHWFIDRYSLADRWLKMIKGRNIFEAISSKGPHHEIDLIFSCLVYVVADGAFHIALLWLIIKMI